MGIIKEKKKFKRTKTQNNPTNPNGDIDKRNKDFDIDNKTIIEQKENK